MPINPNIPLSVQTPDIGGGIMQFVQMKNAQEDRVARQKLIDLQTQKAQTELDEHKKGAKTRQIESLTQRELAAAKSLALAATRVKPLLDAGNVEGAKALMMQRKARLDEEGIDSSDTQEFLGILEKDPKAALDTVDKTIAFGTRLGFLKEAPEQFAEVKDAKGNIVAQKSSTTGKVVEDPRAPKTGRGDYFTSVQTAKGNLVFDNRRGVYIDPVTRKEVRQPVIASQSDPSLQGAITGAKEGAKHTAQAEFDLPRVEQITAQAISDIDKLRGHDGLKYITGAYSLSPVFPNTPQASADALARQIQGQTFLQAYQQLKGGGQITEVEGQKAEAAVARLQRAQSTEDYQGALDDLKSILKNSLGRARKQAGQQQTETASTQPKRIKVDAQGNVIGGN